MKRYDFDRPHCTGDSEYGCPSSIQESSCGDYVRWDDLIAAGVLVPVPDGEAGCAEDLQSKVNAAIWKSQVVLPEPHVWGWVRLDGAYPGIGPEDTVQPVRLVPLEDVEDLLRKSEINNDLG